jgi:PAS domain S-box-containing protein
MEMGKNFFGKFWNPTLRVVTIYLLASVLWILFSDQVLSWFTQDPAWLTRLQSYKGAGFVLVTSIILYILLNREVKKLETKIDENIRISGDLQTSNEQLSAIINSSPLVIVSLDQQLNICTWNPAAEQLFGWKAEEVIGKPLPFLPEESSVESRAIQKRVMEGETIRDHETLRFTKDGRMVNVLLSSAPLHNKNGEIDRIMAILVDITARKQVEEKLKQLSSELELRVQERTAALEETNNALTDQIRERLRIEYELREQTQRLETINNELESFSSSVSHDLRAPLRQISGYSHLLLEESGEALSPQARSDLDRILRGAELMRELIEALLVLSRVSKGDFNEVKIDLAEITREIFQGLSSQEPERKVNLIAPDHLLIHADPRLLRIVMENLLNNAWKFTKKEKNARIEFGVTSSTDNTIVYHVRDNGVGFPAGEAGKIFNAFQRLHDPEEYPGLGIGLATVQRIIRRYGGEIWAKGETDQGATIYFTLGNDREG